MCGLYYNISLKENDYSDFKALNVFNFFQLNTVPATYVYPVYFAAGAGVVAGTVAVASVAGTVAVASAAGVFVAA